MATITFTATAASGQEFTRSSGTMPYEAVLMVSDDGKSWSPYSWHKSLVAASNALNGTYITKYARREVVQAVPTAVNGKVSEGDFADWPIGVPELVAEKLAKESAPKAPKARKSRSKKATEQAEITYESPEAALDAAEATFPELSKVQQPEAAPVAPKAPKAKKATKKQDLGGQLHRVVWAAFEAEGITLPEGMNSEEAREQIANWLRWIPTAETSWGGQARKGA